MMFENVNKGLPIADETRECCPNQEARFEVWNPNLTLISL